MSWRSSKRVILSAAFGMVLCLSRGASASLVPGGPDWSSVFSGGSSGTLRDFGSIFTSGESSPFGDLLTSIPGGDDLVSPCGVVLTNFAPTSAGGCDTEPMFDTIFGGVADEIGMPDDIKDVILGRTSVDDLFSDVLSQTLGDIGIPSTGTLVGSQGIPDPDVLLSELLKPGKAGNVNTAGGPLPTGPEAVAIEGGLAAPNVNTTLMQPVRAMSTLTQAVTARGLSEKGQAITESRNTAGQAISRTSGKIAAASVTVADAQMQAATEMDTTIHEQTSTQDTLKEALAGMNLMQAQSTSLAAQTNSQLALSNQMGAMELQVKQEERDGVFANGRSLQLLNEQMLQAEQKRLAERASARSEHNMMLRTYGAMR